MKTRKVFSLILGIGLCFNIFIKHYITYAATSSDLTNYITRYVTNYKEFPSVIADKEKTFTINFNKDINKATVNRNTIKVLDSAGREVSVGVLSRTDNNKVAQIVSPMDGYIEGETYTLVVTKGVLDTNNKSLGNEIVMRFTIKNENTQQPPVVDNRSEDEKFIDNLYETNSPYWNQGLKFIDGKLNIQNYDYTGWKTLSTSFNLNINKQVIAAFKVLYTEKSGYQVRVNYFKNLWGTTGASASISFDIEDATIRGDAFMGVDFPDTKESSFEGEIFNLSVSDCTRENFNNYKYTIKSVLTPLLFKQIAEESYAFINDEYTKIVLNDYYGIRKYNASRSIYEPKQFKNLSKTFENIKVNISSDGAGIGVTFINL